VIGNARRDDVVDILQRYDPLRIPEKRALLEGGGPALADLARERGIELDPQRCHSVCDMCVSLRRRLAGR
jgi:hypothetical protein